MLTTIALPDSPSSAACLVSFCCIAGRLLLLSDAGKMPSGFDAGELSADSGRNRTDSGFRSRSSTSGVDLFIIYQLGGYSLSTINIYSDVVDALLY